jgi:hypothetical protein
MNIMVLMVTLLLLTRGTICVGSGSHKEADIDEVLQIMSGTWINPEYDERPKEGKCVFHQDGTTENYNKTTDVSLRNRNKYTIAEAWYDREGNIWYKATYVRIGEYGSGNELGKLSNGAAVWESVWSRVKYPEKLDPMRNYSIYYRQD